MALAEANFRLFPAFTQAVEQARTAQSPADQVKALHGLLRFEGVFDASLEVALLKLSLGII